MADASTNARLVLRLVEAWNAGDVDALIALLDTDVEWHDRVLFPDAGVYRGREAVERHLRSIGSALDVRWEVDEVIDAGDSVVLAATLRGHGRESGAPFDARVYAVGTVRDGRVVRRESHSTIEDALRATGCEAVAVVRGMLAAAERGDWSEAIARFDGDVELDMSRMPDGAVYRGPEGVRSFYSGWFGSWDDFDFDIRDATLLDGERVLVRTDVRGAGRETGIGVTMRSANIYTVRDGRIVRAVGYPDAREALAELRSA